MQCWLCEQLVNRTLLALSLFVVANIFIITVVCTVVNRSIIGSVGSSGVSCEWDELCR